MVHVFLCVPFVDRGAISTAVTDEVIDLTGKSAEHMLNW